MMTFPRHLAIRAKTMFLIHGLIPCLGEGLLRGLPVTVLLVLVREGDGKDLMEVRAACRYYFENLSRCRRFAEVDEVLEISVEFLETYVNMRFGTPTGGQRQIAVRVVNSTIILEARRLDTPLVKVVAAQLCY